MVAGLQTSFDFGKKQSYAEEDFVVTDCNRDAFEMVSIWPKWPSRLTAIYGASGCGKTHLANIWVKRSGGILLSYQDILQITPDELINISKYIAIDFEEIIINEHNLFHLINLINQVGGNLLVTSHDSPARWPVTIADLKSRLRGITSVAIHNADEETLYAITLKEFTERNIRIKPDVASYIISSLPDRTYHALHAVIARLDVNSLREHKNITIPFVKRILGAEH